jgi:hypothetical protein
MTIPDPAVRNVARECAAIAADLERLKTLITDAGDRLLMSFNTVSARLPTPGRSGAAADIAGAIGSAVTALQFQDMAAQLIGHAQRRLHVLMNCIEIDQANDPLFAATRAQPVRQTQMNSGSIDLF